MAKFSTLLSIFLAVPKISTREIRLPNHRVRGGTRSEKWTPLIFRPEITCGVLRIGVSFYIFEKITKNRRQPMKPKNHRNEVKFHDQMIELA